jgi:hypothetical protein
MASAEKRLHGLIRTGAAEARVVEHMLAAASLTILPYLPCALDCQRHAAELYSDADEEEDLFPHDQWRALAFPMREDLRMPPLRRAESENGPASEMFRYKGHGSAVDLGF